MIVILKEHCTIQIAPQFVDGFGLVFPNELGFDEDRIVYELYHPQTEASWWVGEGKHVFPYHYMNMVIDHWFAVKDDNIYTDVFKDLTYAHLKELNQGISREL